MLLLFLVVIAYVIFDNIAERKCPNCKKHLALKKINEEKISIELSRIEWKCKYCGHTQWNDWPDWPL